MSRLSHLLTEAADGALRYAAATPSWRLVRSAAALAWSAAAPRRERPQPNPQGAATGLRKVVHLLDSVDPVNFGVWNAALIHSQHLRGLGYQSYAAYPARGFSYEAVTGLPFGQPVELLESLRARRLLPSDTAIVSHGCWSWPTRLAFQLHRAGYAWMFVPHGMLEPWARAQGHPAKRLYWPLVERQLYRHCDLVRAVSAPERERLERSPRMPPVVLVPNGVEPGEAADKDSGLPLRFLFLGRLHRKKGLSPLLRAWCNSSLANKPTKARLTIAGPDDGELTRTRELLTGCTNAEYLGPVYGETKARLLRDSHVFVLPSFSEGFPSSVVEAMSYGLVPLITTGCNFPEALEGGLAEPTTTRSHDILGALERVAAVDSAELLRRGKACSEFARSRYSVGATGVSLAAQLDTLFFRHSEQSSASVQPAPEE